MRAGWLALAVGCAQVDERSERVLSVGFEPSAPLAGDAVACTATGPDADATRLRLNDGPPRLAPLQTGPGDVLRCTATHRGREVGSARVTVGPARAHDVLVLLADDLGTEVVPAYGTGTSPPPMPNVDALAAEGVLFRNAYAAPVCSPSRAQLLTGRHARRTGLGAVIRPYDTDYALPADELLLPELVREVGWASAIVGKWHLIGLLAPDPALHPLVSGFDHHTGPLANPAQVVAHARRSADYYGWERWDDGAVSWEDRYLTSVTADRAAELAQTLPRPWVIVVAFNAPHAPYQRPPERLVGEPAPPDADARDVYSSMVEAMDTEIGSLLASVDRSSTVIVFAGDNGTPTTVVPPRLEQRTKGSIYEGGIHVPLIVAGPDVAAPGTESAALVHLVDVFATVQHVAGVPARDLDRPIDGQSLLPHLADPAAPGRSTVIAEWFTPNGRPVAPERSMVAVRDVRFKLARTFDGTTRTEALFDLLADPDEQTDLLQAPLDPDATAALERLTAAADSHESIR